VCEFIRKPAADNDIFFFLETSILNYINVTIHLINTYIIGGTCGTKFRRDFPKLFNLKSFKLHKYGTIAEYPAGFALVQFFSWPILYNILHDFVDFVVYLNSLTNNRCQCTYSFVK